MEKSKGRKKRIKPNPMTAQESEPRERITEIRRFLRRVRTKEDKIPHPQYFRGAELRTWYEIARFLCVSISTAKRWARLKIPPMPIRRLGRKVRAYLSDMQHYQSEKERISNEIMEETRPRMRELALRRHGKSLPKNVSDADLSVVNRNARPGCVSKTLLETIGLTQFGVARYVDIDEFRRNRGDNG